MGSRNHSAQSLLPGILPAKEARKCSLSLCLEEEEMDLSK